MELWKKDCNSSWRPRKMNFGALPRSRCLSRVRTRNAIFYHFIDFFKLFSLCTDTLKLARSLIKKLLFIVDKEHCASQSRWRSRLCTRIHVCSSIRSSQKLSLIFYLSLPFPPPALCFQLTCYTYTAEMGLRSERANGGKRVNDARHRLEIAIVAPSGSCAMRKLSIRWIVTLNLAWSANWSTRLRGLSVDEKFLLSDR